MIGREEYAVPLVQQRRYAVETADLELLDPMHPAQCALEVELPRPDHQRPDRRWVEAIGKLVGEGKLSHWGDPSKGGHDLPRPGTQRGRQRRFRGMARMPKQIIATAPKIEALMAASSSSAITRSE